MTRAAPIVAIWSTAGAGIPLCWYSSSSRMNVDPVLLSVPGDDRNARVVESLEQPRVLRGAGVPLSCQRALPHPQVERPVDHRVPSPSGG